MLWTKKHTTYSVLHRLTPTARELWQWLLDEMPEGSHEIIDLRDFNKKVLEFPLHQVKLAIAYFLFRYPDEQSREEIRTVQGTLIYFLRQKCWNWNHNFLGNLAAYRLVPDWVIKLCISDDTLDWGY